MHGRLVKSTCGQRHRGRALVRSNQHDVFVEVGDPPSLRDDLPLRRQERRGAERHRVLPGRNDEVESTVAPRHGPSKVGTSVDRHGDARKTDSLRAEDSAVNGRDDIAADLRRIDALLECCGALNEELHRGAEVRRD